MADKAEPVASAAGDTMIDEAVERLLDKADASGAALLGEGGLLTEITLPTKINVHVHRECRRPPPS
ncbi:hypothetical protein ACFWAG_09870 [Streptomyces violascens]|uniref:hypothetical protein n=1 Tax=Streptomyces violascens TaxID=67381 RepID=UPI00364BB475